MLIEYEDLVEQLTEFRLQVVKALAAIDLEINALQTAILKQKPILREELNRLRLASRESLPQFEQFHSQKLPLLHEKR